MDQIKTGKFIADERKKKGYTQRQLAEQLGISDKTISKWERGNGFPEISLLLPLCNELDLSVNELLTGERISETEYREKAEENMVNLVKEAQESKKKIILSGMVSAQASRLFCPLLADGGPWGR
jgi:transcriptional regulator with XRE-family HTH domain